ncbi:hypothetical protein B0T17DRAFT_507310 [Bombardia bombarda]|uniref:Uncharacterized protein n=1 Tax=Bombardia bombarda TaxID=252184 RepID=A0AA40CAW3_9PEZI|nr:hypothetical protein B0T17DRAFT_507310 [Bombardia bombarda]
MQQQCPMQPSPGPDKRVAFILMQFLPSNVAMDADGGYKAHGGSIPSERCHGFCSAVARIQVQMASVRLLKIGTVIKKEGRRRLRSWSIPRHWRPIQDTAAEYFEAWAAHAKFPVSETSIHKMMKGGPVDEIVASIEVFPSQIREIEDRLASLLGAHADFLRSNIVADRDYSIIGVID